MLSSVSDVASISRGINEYHRSQGGDVDRFFFDGGPSKVKELYKAWFVPIVHQEVATVDGLNTLVTGDSDELNSFMQANGYEPQFEPFVSPELIGIASATTQVIDPAGGFNPVIINKFCDEEWGYTPYEGYLIGAKHVSFYCSNGFFKRVLICIKTTTGHKVWLMAMEPAAGRIGLHHIARRMVMTSRVTNEHYTNGVIVPRFNVTTVPDSREWLVRSFMRKIGRWDRYVSQAFQTTTVKTNDLHDLPEADRKYVRVPNSSDGPLVLDMPFVGCITAPGQDRLVLSTFYAHYDSWRTFDWDRP